MAAKTTYSNWTYISYKHQRNTTTNRKVYLTQATWCGINVHTVIRRRRRTQLQQQVYSPSLQTKWRRRRQQLLNNFPRFQTDLCGTRYWRAATRQLYIAGVCLWYDLVADVCYTVVIGGHLDDVEASVVVPLDVPVDVHDRQRSDGLHLDDVSNVRRSFDWRAGTKNNEALDLDATDLWNARPA